MADRDRLAAELDITGSMDEEERLNAPMIRLMEDVTDHGEVHAEFADDADRYIEVRKGTTTFDFEGGVLAIDDGVTEHRFAMNQLTNWHKPRNVFDQE